MTDLDRNEPHSTVLLHCQESSAALCAPGMPRAVGCLDLQQSSDAQQPYALPDVAFDPSLLAWPQQASHLQLLEPAVATAAASAPFLTCMATHLRRLCDTATPAEACTASTSVGDGDAREDVFRAAKVPVISLLDYVLRLARLTKASTICFVYALAYVITAAERGHVSMRTVHRHALPF